MEKIELELYDGLVIGSILLGALLLTRLIRWLMSRAFRMASKKIKVDPTRYRFSKNAVSFIIWLIALGVIASLIPQLRAVAITLFAGAGILVAILGFAAQQAFANIIAGIFIVIFKPFRVGDMIKVGSLDYGIVEDITLRHTVIRNFENKRIIIPNSVISNENIVNDTFSNENLICRWIDIGISYDTNIEQAVKIIQEAAVAHPLCIDNRKREEKRKGIPQVIVRTLKFDEYSINLRAYVWTKDPLNAVQMHSDINNVIKQRFDEEGIEIPFPYRTIVYKKDMDEKAK